MEKLREYIEKNRTKLSGTGKKEIPDIDDRVIRNLKEIGGFKIPENILNIYDLLLYLDENGGRCSLEGCSNNKKIKSGRKWILNDFCSYECSCLSFSKKQTFDNTSKRMTKESKESMREKLSHIVRQKILDGKFTPCVTNSWARSKINVLIKGTVYKVRSSWEAFFYILNPNLIYESLRITYFDPNKGIYRNYIVDFFDPEGRKLYEIKPNSRMDFCISKKEAADKWCSENKFDFIYITEEWLKKNYDRSLIIDQPDFLKISRLIEKSLKYMK